MAEKIESEKIGMSQRIELLKAINDLFPEATEKYSREEYAKLEIKACTDPTMICLIEGKSEAAGELLYDFCDKNSEIPKIDLKYTAKEGVEIVSKFSVEFLQLVFRILQLSNNESIFFRLNHDYSLMLENQHFRFVLASRSIDQ